MPLTELDPNVTGRSSRASNLSASSHNGHKDSGFGTLSAAPGVLSMLKTSTELGNIGAPGTQSNRFLAASGYQRQRKSRTTPLSHSSSQHSFNGSQISRQSSTRSGRAPSIRSVPKSATRHGLIQAHSDGLSSTSLKSLSRTGSGGSRKHYRNGRSYTMTQGSVLPPRPLPINRSLTSLRSHGLPSRPRSPFVYPTRLRRPGYRPSSPATSDVTAPYHTRTPYPQAGSRASSVSPFIPQDPHHFPYRQGPNRSAPVLATNDPLFETRVQARSSASDPAPYSSSAPRADMPASVIIHQHMTTLQRPSIAQLSSQPRYYDYSEQSENVRIGEERKIDHPSEEEVIIVHPDMLVPIEDSGKQVSEIAELYASDVAELPASPVVRRLTRELVKAVIDVTSDEASESEEHNTTSINDAMGTALLSSPETPKPLEPCSTATKSPPKDDDAGDSSTIGSLATARASGASDAISASVHAIPSSPPAAGSVLSKSSISESAFSSEESNAMTDSPATSTESGMRMPKSIMNNGQAQPRTPSSSLRRRSATITLPAVIETGPYPASLPVPRPVSAFGQLSPGFPAPPQATQDESVAESPSSKRESSGRQQISEAEQAASGVPQHVHSLESLSSGHAAGRDSATVSLYSFGSQSNDARARESHASTDLLQNARNTFARHLSALEDMRNAARVSCETNSSGNSTTDLRFSSLRYPVTHLSDLKEESQEDISSTNLRTLGFNFALPKSDLMRVSSDSKITPTESSVADRLGLIELSRPLGEVRAIPSLNFSRLDLITKLNDALTTRSSLARDYKTHSSMPRISALVPERSTSSALVRPSYKSYFVEESESNGVASEEAPTVVEPVVEPTASLATRPLSADDIDIIAQVNRLSVPSVDGLTQRLSELLPSLRRYDMGGDGTIFEESNEEPGNGSSARVERPDTLASARASSEFRALAAAADMVAMSRGSHVRSDYLTNKIARDVEALGLMKALPPLPDDSEVSKTDSRLAPTITSLDDVCRRMSIAELEAPLPAKIRESWNAEGGHDDLDKQRVELHEPVRAAIGTPTGSRPWNLEASYPWSDTAPTIEIAVLAPTHRPGSVGLTHSKLHRSHSASELPQGATAPLTSPSQDSPTVVSDTARPGGGPEQKRKNSKRSILGSLSRKIGLSRGAFDQSGFPTGPDMFRPGDTRSFEPGDRYPTSGLTPPAAFNLEEVRSFFSDDSDATERPGSFRKRLTALKRGRPAQAARTSSRQAGGGDEYGSFGHEGGRAFDFDGWSADGCAIARPHDHAVGMGKVEFRARKVVERLKSIWFKSGELWRSMSGRKRAGHGHGHAWDRESDLYSGT